MEIKVKYKKEVNRILLEIEKDLFPYLGEGQRHKLLILLHDLIHAAYDFGYGEGVLKEKGEENGVNECE